ncbi:ATPase family associated with various cellular activities (AAA) [Streptoalloteichus tenebrarius]|uniref:ATPase family associated with various cellular activities (AAA) n=1 Tax=Streptoalloteichus tenebrarius (strain ATCC 17920 / DSM 40477 / JCM 4838 / CBS 697.72 / NBRC 16177 / NCIMB 11028 / NRRL B-12390 / A12253. 1 / ISP 5477) TaxID=1933 RepID=A0ABT1HUG9_STRSD|nr:ATP-binding protein [Streptoalloteichus tenebrarius]MCP2259152.1 ATPase family associated with various cellular activities (AAA) [Streptoalloteichus tenebrarius]BFF04371.1 ATP-binding protein [Streptoalloteichus tenebrarius]
MGRGGAPGGEAHQRALAAAVRAVLAHVDAHAGRRDSPVEAPRVPETSALGTLCSCFGLSPFERDVLVLACAAELDSSAGARCAAASGDPRRDYPTFSLALAALPDAHWSALTPVAPLRRWRLVEPADDGPLTTSRLRVDERVLHFLAGVPYVDSRLHGLVTRVDPVPDLPASHGRAAEAISTAWHEVEGRPHVELVGGDQHTRWEVAATAASEAGAALYVLRAADLPSDPAEREATARLWERESLLLPAVLLVEAGEASASSTLSGSALSTVDWLAALEMFAHALAVPLVLSSDEPLRTEQRHRVRVAVDTPTEDEQRALWAAALRSEEYTPDDQELARLVAQFSLPAHVIRAAGATARRAVVEGAATEEAVEDGADGVTDLAWRAGLRQARVALDELGRRVEPRARWDDLVVPEAQRAILAEIVAQVRQRATVYQDWGFEAVLRRGLGVTALFAGTSGTGKTLAAEVLAGELGVDLFVVDLSQVVSKYIGETEKNLRRVFDAAERGGALLLFDEADALFGRRSEIRDSHDRYANIEVSYLLMRMESYRGLAILTTNMKKALDPAFLRRIRFVVDFPFPGPAERAEIWRRVIPPSAPTDGVDLERLAQLTVAGGSIRNIALSAAFLAADEGVPVGMRHFLAASRTEYLKLERSLTPGEVAGWE